MDRSEFLKQEYLTLRREIYATKDRIFKIMGFGLVVVPSSHLLAETLEIEMVTYSLPLLVIVVALIFLAENNALMRCGHYIKNSIEKSVQDIVGWENWLESKSAFPTRNVDKYCSWAFYLLFFVYYVGSVFIATKVSLESFKEYGTIPTSILLGSYIAVGISFGIYLFNNIRASTTAPSILPNN